MLRRKEKSYVDYLEEKRVARAEQNERSQAGCVAIVVCQHVLLWCSAFVVASEVYMLVVGAITSDLLPAAILLMVSGFVSLCYISLHGLAAMLLRKAAKYAQNSTKTLAQWLATVSLRIAVTVWLAACGLNLTFTIARQLSCSAQRGPTTINNGVTCIVQRTGVGTSLMALMAASALFILVHKISDPFRCHLFGIIKESTLLPLMLPYKAAADRALFSEISFKCRSSSSLSSHTLVQSRQSSTAHLLPTCPEKAALGLGIYAPKQQAPSFLTPRPSLSSIRTHTTMASRPPSSPLPPLPAYFPEKYQRPSAMHKAVHPPRPPRPYSFSRTQSSRTVCIVPPSPALSTANLLAHNRSVESLSSVYSRSISGDKHSPRPGALSEGSRSYSSSSTATVVKSPLGAMRRADDPETVVMPGFCSRSSSESSDSDIDNARALQAKLPSVKAVSDFGEVEDWPLSRQMPSSYCERAHAEDTGTKRRLAFTPLMVRKTRDIASHVAANDIVAIA